MGSGEFPSLLMFGWVDPHAFGCQRSLALTFSCSACSFAVIALETDLADTSRGDVGDMAPITLQFLSAEGNGNGSSGETIHAFLKLLAPDRPGL